MIKERIKDKVKEKLEDLVRRCGQKYRPRGKCETVVEKKVGEVFVQGSSLQK